MNFQKAEECKLIFVTGPCVSIIIPHNFLVSLTTFRTIRMSFSWNSWSPKEKFKRATVIPFCTSSRICDSVAFGPNVHTIFVREGNAAAGFVRNAFDISIPHFTTHILIRNTNIDSKRISFSIKQRANYCDFMSK